MKTKLIALSIVLTFLFNLCGMSVKANAKELQNSSTIGSYSQSNKFYDFDTHQKIYNQLKEIGLNDQQINYLFIKELTRSNISTYSFPSNPSIGDWHTETFTFYTDWITGAMTVAEITMVIMEHYGFVASMWAHVAAIAINGLASVADYDYYVIEIDYRYGETNDGLVDWNMGPVRVNGYNE